uniref:Kunitz type protease inhibitor n=1 Tax=Odontomachus monticola TaxID=613454 RepID=A0A348G5Z7_ODOMO
MSLKVCLLLMLITVSMLTHEIVAQKSAHCQSPIDKGSCRAVMKRYAYNPAMNQCEQFMYGGCGGNENNFKTEQECEETCV